MENGLLGPSGENVLQAAMVGYVEDFALAAILLRILVAGHVLDQHRTQRLATHINVLSMVTGHPGANGPHVQYLVLVEFVSVTVPALIHLHDLGVAAVQVTIHNRNNALYIPVKACLLMLLAIFWESLMVKILVFHLYLSTPLKREKKRQLLPPLATSLMKSVTCFV